MSFVEAGRARGAAASRGVAAPPVNGTRRSAAPPAGAADEWTAMDALQEARYRARMARAARQAPPPGPHFTPGLMPSQARYGLHNTDSSGVGWHSEGAMRPMDEARAREARRRAADAASMANEWSAVQSAVRELQGPDPRTVKRAPLPLHRRAGRLLLYGAQRAWYMFDARLSSYEFQSACMLAVATAVALGGGKWLQEQLHNPDVSSPPQDFSEYVWMVVVLFLSGSWGPSHYYYPGSSAGRFSAFVIVILGILFLNVVIAVLLRAVQAKMRALKQGLSPVVETRHTVVLGFGAAVLSIIRELCLANASEGGGVVAVLARGDTVAMAAELHAFLTPAELYGTKVVFRNGSRLRFGDLARVSVATARAVIGVTDGRRDSQTADGEMLQTMLNLSGLEMAPGANVVADVRDTDNEGVIQLISDANVATVTSHAIVGSLLLFFVRQPGLARVYNAVLGFEGSEFYCASWPALRGARWSDVFACFPHAVPIGIRHAGGAVELNPPAEARMAPDDELIVLAEDNDTYACEAAAVLGERAAAPVPPPPLPPPEVLLLLGWRRDLAHVVALYDRIAPPDSELHVLCDVAVEERNDELEATGLPPLRNLRLVHHLGATTSARAMSALPLTRASHALVLASDDEATEAAHSDSHGLVVLTQLRKCRGAALAAAAAARAQAARAAPPASRQTMRGRSRQQSAYGDAPLPPQHLPIVVEILDPRTQRTVDASVTVSHQAEFVLSNELTSKMLAMISEDRSVKHILDALVGKAATHLALMRAEECLPARSVSKGGAASFWELARECVLEHGATLLGLIEPQDTASMLAPPSPVVINPPDKALRRTWRGVTLVVIKRDVRLMELALAPRSRSASPRSRSTSPRAGRRTAPRFDMVDEDAFAALT